MRSRMTSRCSNPRNPQRKPNPNAADVSISNEKDASFSASFSIASRRSSNSALSTGKSPQNTTGCAGLKPGNASTSFLSWVIVSPTRVSRTCLIEAVKKPISPGPRLSKGSISGRNTPTRSTWWVVPFERNLMRSPFFRRPSITRTNTITPRYASYHESTSIAFSVPSGLPFGDGRRVTMASSVSRMPCPVLADTAMAPEASMPITSSICSATRSKSDAGRSILFSTGTNSWSASIA